MFPAQPPSPRRLLCLWFSLTSPAPLQPYLKSYLCSFSASPHFPFLLLLAWELNLICSSFKVFSSRISLGRSDTCLFPWQVRLDRESDVACQTLWKQICFPPGNHNEGCSRLLFQDPVLDTGRERRSHVIFRNIISVSHVLARGRGGMPLEVQGLRGFRSVLCVKRDLWDAGIKCRC